MSNFFGTPWTVAYQAPLSVGFCRQEYWSGLLFPPPGDLPDPGIKLLSLMSPALADRLFTTIPPGKPSLTYFPLTSKAFVLLDWVEFGLGCIGSLPCSPFLLLLGLAERAHQFLSNALASS